jgi:hypothetical protein
MFGYLYGIKIANIMSVLTEKRRYSERLNVKRKRGPRDQRPWRPILRELSPITLIGGTLTN